MSQNNAKESRDTLVSQNGNSKPPSNFPPRSNSLKFTSTAKRPVVV